VKGDYIYYAGYDRNKKDGAQLYRVKKSSSNTWGNPEEIKPLNSPGDDILPYFDPIENDLYFASNGRLGVGGFDLYRSHYDSERDKWSEPLNLGFPVNSAMDEYLLLPGSDLGMVIFFSNRQATDSSVAVYRVHLAEPKKKTVANDSQMLREIAQLGKIAEDILAELEKMDQSGPAAPSDKLSSRISPTETLKEPPSHPTPVRVVSESNGQARYRHILSQAMKHESASDSLTSLANQTRDQAMDSEDPNDRWVWQKQIMLWEKKARDEAAIADALYAKLDRERTANQARVSRLVPAAIEVDTVMGDLTVYRYKPSQARPAEPQTKAPAAPEVVLVSSPSAPVPKTAAKPIPDGIDILGESPYSTQNPIPMDVSLPPGVFYRVQMGSFAAEVDPDAFGGISPISGVRSGGGGRVRYFAGKFRNYADASEALSMIRNSGYADAFIVAWYNGNIVSTQEAKALE
jgi:hypothetical protein